MARSEIMVYVPIATGEYTIRVAEAELTTSKFKYEDGTPKQQIKLTVDVLDTDNRQMPFWCNWPPYKKSQIVKYAKAFGLDCEDSLDTDDLIGREAVAVIIAYTKDDGEEANRIEEIKAKKTGAAAPPRQPVAASTPGLPTAQAVKDPFVADGDECITSAQANELLNEAKGVTLNVRGTRKWLAETYQIEMPIKLKASLYDDALGKLFTLDEAQITKFNE